MSIHSGLTSVIIVIACAVLIYVAAIGAVLIVLIGVVRYALSQNRDRRLITHPVLFAIVLVLAILIIEQLSGCM
jgi:NADH:ubiquinone oxidoreductase subunit 6 (subunit J)